MLRIPCTSAVFQPRFRMRRGELRLLLWQCREGESLSADKLAALPRDTRERMVWRLLQSRAPILACLLGGLDRRWLSVAGYTRETQSPSHPEYTFLHTELHVIV